MTHRTRSSSTSGSCLPPTLARLTDFELLVGVPEDLLHLVAQSPIRFYANNDEILRQGDPADELLILLHGHVDIINNDTHILARRAPAIIGEQGIINGATRNASVVARGIVEAIVVERLTINILFQNLTFTKNLLRVVSTKLTEATTERAYRFKKEQLLFTEFRAHLSPEVINQLLATGQAYGAPRHINGAILFSDIRSFTQQSQHMEPAAIAEWLTAYFDVMVPIVHNHGGLVDKFIGDALLAVWGFHGKPEGCAQAFACAITMIDAVRQLHFDGTPTRVGIGLSTGKVFIGNVGSDAKRQFTVLGHAVNMASRYQDATKELKMPVALGETFMQQLPASSRKLCLAHEITVSGIGRQTVYTYDLP